MKNVRIFLTVLAVVFAVGGTVAGKVHSALSMTGYEYIPASGGDPAVCSSFTTSCQPTGANLCTINSHKVGSADNVSTSCGNQLKFN